MITFERRSLWQSLRYRFSPTYRAECDASTRQAIKWLVDHPEAPCSVEGTLVPHGYGNSRLTDGIWRDWAGS